MKHTSDTQHELLQRSQTTAHTRMCDLRLVEGCEVREDTDTEPGEEAPREHHIHVLSAGLKGAAEPTHGVS